MSFEKLKLHSHELIQYMRDNEYSESYIQLLQSEINWIQKNSDSFDSYESACLYREKGTASYDMKRRYRLFYGIMKRFDVDGVLPDYRRKEPLFKRGAYHKLCAVFQKIIDYYCEDAGLRNLKLQTINGNASGGSIFLLAMQEKGHFSLDEISEDDAMSFFTDSSGMVVLSDSYRKEVSAVLSADLGEYTQAARQVHTYLPRTRNRRKNIAYLQPEETACIHNTIEDNSAGKLSLRDRAVASLLYYNGLRGCDIVGLTFSDIDWENDEIRIIQEKTDVPLSLPLVPVVGNAIYDYITTERPNSDDPHIFLGARRPYDPLTAKGMWNVAIKIYRAAGVRQEEDSRKGTHLFRYNAANTFVGSGVSRPVASSVLGHEDPNSLDYYTFADITHLRECALSIEAFPVRKGVYGA